MRSSAKRSTLYSFLAILMIAVPAAAQQAQGSSPAKLYNTAKQKLLDGKQIFSFTQSELDVEGYCESAKHYDYAWIEMQHSTLDFGDVAKMISACPHAAAIPFIRVPDAQEMNIQHATDVGALGIIVPTVDDAERARDAAKWLRHPPVGRRSTGRGLFSTIYRGEEYNYRQTANDNMLLVVMIETPVGVANAFEIASVPGVDVVIVGNNDLSQFSGFAATDERYQQLITKIHDDTLKAGKIFGQANPSFATGHPLSKTSLFFQNGPSNDGWKPAGR